MGQHKLAAPNHGQKPTTHKTNITTFNARQSKMIHESAAIVDNVLKSKVLDEYVTARTRAEHLANEGNFYEAKKAERLAARLHAQHAAMPDRIVGSRKTFKIGSNQAKKLRSMIKASGKRNRRFAKQNNIGTAMHTGSTSFANLPQNLPRT